MHSINGLLPEDIAIRMIEEVDEEFHARKSATRRWYRFTIYNHTQKSALNKRCLCVSYYLDDGLMNKALQKIVGTHNFDSFKSAKSDNPNSECTIEQIRCFRDKDFVHIDIIANRFIHNMIRIIVGTVIETGKNEAPVDHLYNVLKASDRTKAGMTVKPDGLTLMAVEYPEHYNLFAKDKNTKVNEIMLINLMEAQNEDLLCKAS